MAAERIGHVVWKGDLAHGEGRASARSSGLFTDVPVTWASRTERSEGKTSPEELLAAAHASCFAMALSGELARAGHKPESLEVTAKVTFDKPDGGWAVTSSALEVKGRVPGISGDDFRKAAEGAKDGCPVSKALRGNVQLSVRAELLKG